MTSSFRSVSIISSDSYDSFSDPSPSPSSVSSNQTNNMYQHLVFQHFDENPDSYWSSSSTVSLVFKYAIHPSSVPLFPEPSLFLADWYFYIVKTYSNLEPLEPPIYNFYLVATPPLPFAQIQFKIPFHPFPHIPLP